VDKLRGMRTQSGAVLANLLGHDQHEIALPFWSRGVIHQSATSSLSKCTNEDLRGISASILRGFAGSLPKAAEQLCEDDLLVTLLALQRRATDIGGVESLYVSDTPVSHAGMRASECFTTIIQNSQNPPRWIATTPYAKDSEAGGAIPLCISPDYRNRIQKKVLELGPPSGTMGLDGAFSTTFLTGVKCGNPHCSVPKSRTPRKFMSCSRCRTVKYCGSDCQKAHWSVHKKICVQAAPAHRPPQERVASRKPSCEAGSAQISAHRLQQLQHVHLIRFPMLR